MKIIDFFFHPKLSKEEKKDLKEKEKKLYLERRKKLIEEKYNE